MNKTSYSKRGLAAFSALLIVAILLSLTLTNLFSSKAEETVASDQAKGNTQASNPSSSSPTNNDDDNVVEDVDVAQPKNDPAPSKPIPGQVVVQFSPNSSEQERSDYVESLGGTVVNTIEALDTVVLNVSEEIAQAPLPASPIVEQAEQAHFVSALDTVPPPDDPNYASQWALSAINASSAWAQIPANTPIVTVAVIDTGICSTHEDLAGRISAGWDFIENDATPQDANGHGCFVSGLIAANMNNGIGIAGVAPNTRIMPLRVLDASGSGSDFNVAAAIVYAADHGAQVINLSLGGDYPSSAMENAVNYAVAKGVSVVAAAGNSGTLGALYPAKYPAAIAVGSLDSNLQHSSFSNYGPDVDIWAPGGNVMSTNLSGGYGSGSGTSFASPYVAGAKAIDLALNRAIALTGGNLDFNDASSIVILPSAPTNDTGSIVALAAANDAIGSATVIPTILTSPYTEVIDTTGATTAAGDPTPTSCNYYPTNPTQVKNSHSVWYKYTAGAAGGRLHVDTRSSIVLPIIIPNYPEQLNTVVAIWTEGLTQVACNDNEPSNDNVTKTSYLELSVTAGTYYIEVMSFDTTSGGNLHFNFDFAPNPGPINDTYTGAITIPQPPTPTSIYSYTNPQDTRLATRTVNNPRLPTDDPRSCDATHTFLDSSGGASVWYKYIVPALTPPGFEIQIDTKGSAYDTVLSVWTWTNTPPPNADGNFVRIDCNDDIGDGLGGFTYNSSLRITVTPNETYYILVTSKSVSPYAAGSLSSAADKSGDVSAQYDGGSLTLHLYSPAPFGPGIYDDTDPAWSYTGTWRTYTGSGPYANTMHYSKVTGSEASFYFEGVGFILKYVKNFNRGNIEVWVDGVKEGTINANNATFVWQSTYTSQFYTSGAHTVVFKHAGTAGTYIDIDSIQIMAAPTPMGAGTYDDANTAWYYGGTWTANSGGVGPYAGTQHYTSTPNAMAAFSFTGPAKFVLSYTKYSNRGSFEVYVDNVLVTTVNAYDAGLLWQQTYTSPSYLSGTHTLVLKNINPSGTYVDVDAIQIVTPPTPVGPGTYDDASAAWVYSGSWTAYTSTGIGPYANTQHYTSTPNQTATLSFSGPAKFVLSYTKYLNRGSFEVYVDELLVTTVNAYNASLLWQQTYTSPNYSAGTHTLVLKNINPSGTYIDVDAIQIIAPIDITAPSAITDLAAVSGPSTGTVNLNWKAPGDDGITGTATSYLVRYSTALIDASNWASATAVTTGIPVPLAYNTPQSMTVTGLMPGATYYFAVRALDEEANLGGVSNSLFAVATNTLVPVAAGIYDDANAAWYYGGAWTANSGNVGPYAGTQHYTSTPNAIAAFSFTGPAKFVLSYTKYPNRGSFEVYVDNALVTTINAYDASLLWQQTYTSPLYSSGTHTVALKNISPSGKYVDVDATQIVAPASPGATIYDDGNALWTYTGAWTPYAGAGPYANTIHYTFTPNDTATFLFTGPARFVLSYTKNSNRGSFEIYVDELLVDTINAYDASLLWQQKYTSPAYSSGIHTVKIKNINPSGTYIDVDAIQIIAPIDIVPPSTITNLAAVSGTGTGTVNLSWTAPGDDYGPPPTGTATSYLVRYSTVPIINSGTWASATPVTTGIPAPLAYNTAQSMTVTGLMPGATYYFAVRALDEEANLGDVSNSPSAIAKAPAAVVADIYDDANGAWYYGGAWIANSGGVGPYAGTQHYTSTQNAIAAFSFTGPAKFVLSYTKYSNRGSFEVYVDNALVTTVNAYSPSLLWQQTYTSLFFTTGTHTLVLKNISPSGTYIDVDAIQIVAPPPPVSPSLVPYDDANAAWVYAGSWTAYSGTGPYANTIHYTFTPNDTATLSFTGPAKFILTYTKSSNRGSFEIYVDELLVDTINAYDANLLWQQTYTSPSYSPDTHTVKIKNISPSGKIVDVDAIQITAPPVDITEPSAITDLAAVSGASTGSVDLSWMAPGDDYGPPPTGTATSYLVRYSTVPIINSGTWASATPVTTGIPAPLAYNTAQSMTVTGLMPGATYYFAVRALDEEANLGDVSNSPSAIAKAPAAVAADIYDDANGAWYYGGTWTANSGGVGPYAGTQHYTSTQNAIAAFSFTGPAKFVLSYTKYSNRGSFEVYVDNVLVTTVNAYDAGLLWQQKYTSPLYSSGTHTVVLKNINPSGTYIDVDAFQIVEPASPGATIYDDGNALWTYTGAWTPYTGVGPYANTIHYTSTPNDTATFSFTGPARFVLTYTKNSNRGSFEVYVDELLVDTINAYDASLLWQQTYTSPSYSSDTHTVKIKHDGPNNSSSGTYIDVDSIQIIAP